MKIETESEAREIKNCERNEKVICYKIQPFRLDL